MELIDLTKPYDGISDLRKEVERIYENKGFTEEEKNALLQDSKYRAPLRDIRRFTESALGRAMKKAAVIRKEMPFSLLLPAKRFYPGCEEGEKVFMQGIMDCLIERDGHIVIIDYKTDRTTPLKNCKAITEPSSSIKTQQSSFSASRSSAHTCGLSTWDR
ncbi:MAG: PD-(D/E)XK nuclease family protein [Dialister invisus]